MILLSCECHACGRGWVRAIPSFPASVVGDRLDDPCLFCGWPSVDYVAHDNAVELGARAA